MFENLTANNAAGYVIHASGQKIEVSDAIKSLTQSSVSRSRTDVPRNVPAASSSAESVEDYSCSTQSSPVGEQVSPEGRY